MKLKLFIYALLALLVAGCTRDPLQEPEKGGGRRVIISATIPAETRVAYDDDRLTLSWEKGDQLLLVGYYADGSYAGHPTFTWLRGNSFEGDEVAKAETYKAYYPAGAIKLDRNGNVLPFDDNFWEQTQYEDCTTAHLRNKLLLFDVTANSLKETFKLELKSSIMRFFIKGIPAKVGTLKKMIWTVETNKNAGTRSATLNFEKIPDNIDGLIAYLAFDPAVMKIDEQGLVEITLIGERQYRWETTSGGMEYKPGARYTGTVGDKWQAVNSFMYTIRIREAGTRYEIWQPFTPTNNPANIKIKWGDGYFDRIDKGTALYDAVIIAHEYKNEGNYTITIESDQSDYKKPQMPQITFGDPAGFNNTTLTTVLTPFLNMNASNFGKCFAQCHSLISLPAGLFKYNPKATIFYHCFYRDGLLILNPDIFPNPATDPNYFAGMNMDFELCFFGVGGKTEPYPPTGTAPELWKFDRGGATWTTVGCFKGAYVTNAGDIPNEWL